MPTEKQLEFEFMNEKEVSTENRHVFPRERRKRQGSFANRKVFSDKKFIREEDPTTKKINIKILPSR